jgi:hypothetical protein
MKAGLERRLRILEQEFSYVKSSQYGIELVLWRDDDEPEGVEISPGLYEMPDEVDS